MFTLFCIFLFAISRFEVSQFRLSGSIVEQE
jgi:hypothetical protein